MVRRIGAEMTTATETKAVKTKALKKDTLEGNLKVRHQRTVAKELYLRQRQYPNPYLEVPPLPLLRK